MTEELDSRLIHVERAHNELNAKVAENTLGIQFLAKEIGENYQRLGEKIDSCIAPLSHQLNEIQQHSVALGEVVGGHSKVLDRIQDEKKRAAEKWDNWKKAILAVLTGGAAIGVKELVVFAWKHF